MLAGAMNATWRCSGCDASPCAGLSSELFMATSPRHARLVFRSVRAHMTQGSVTSLPTTSFAGELVQAGSVPVGRLRPLNVRLCTLTRAPQPAYEKENSHGPRDSRPKRTCRE